MLFFNSEYSLIHEIYLLIKGYVFLHGTLLFDVNSADDLPDMESWIAKVIDGKGNVDLIGKAIMRYNKFVLVLMQN